MPRLRLLPPVEVADTVEEAAPILNYLMNRGGRLAVDTETTGLDVMRDRVLFWSMATEDRRFCFPVEILLFFDPLFQRADISWYLANAKYDMHMLANMGTGLAGDVWDIIPMDAMEDDTRPHGLKEQSKYAYDASWGDFKDLFLNPTFVARELGLDKTSFTAFKKKEVGEKLLFVYDERPDLVEDYASCDAFFTYMRGEDLCAHLAAEDLPTDMVPEMNTLLDYYRVIEMPLTKSLWGMERQGFPVDWDYVKKIDGPMKDGIAAAERKIYKAAGTTFNPASADELRDILFGDKGFGLKPFKYTSGGKSGEPKPSTDQKTLEILRDRVRMDGPAYRFLDAMLVHRHLVKLHGTYVKNLRDNVGPDGKVHCRLNQAGARTSRLSSAGPNMQNIPIRNDPYKIRGIFTAEPGCLLVDYDYPQIEFRIAAVLAGEKKMMDDIHRGWDCHSANANNMYADATYEGITEARRKKDAGEPLTDFDKKMLRYRDGAKTSGLAALYGQGVRRMAAQLGCSVDEARDLVDDFFDANPAIGGLIDFMHAYGHEHEITYTMLGRIRRLHRINNEYSRGLVKQEERIAFNTLIQGSGAEMMKLAILRVDADERFHQLGGKLVLTVHDELIAMAPEDTAHEVGEIMKELMADPFRWGPIDFSYPVPITPDGSIAFRWSEAK